MLDTFPRFNIHPNITMEENNNIESANQTEEVVAQEVTTESVTAEVATPETEVSAQPEVVVASPETDVKPEVKQVRRNGRNRSGIRKSVAVSQASAEACGELENPSEFKEKLSGQNVSGYAEGEGASEERPKRERRERGERKPRNRRDDAVASNESQNEEKPAETAENAEEQHEGPSFESKGFTPRAVEVALSDGRPRGKQEASVDDGVVSYTPEDNKCSISLFERIKTLIKSIFGKKEKSKKRHNNKKGGKKNWNNNRDNGKKNWNNNRKHNGKGGYNKRRFNDRRPNGNKGRQSGTEA